MNHNPAGNTTAGTIGLTRARAFLSDSVNRYVLVGADNIKPAFVAQQKMFADGTKEMTFLLHFETS